MSGHQQKIPGGYYLKARCVQNSEIATAPPHVREIWDWLLHNANYKDHGPLKRGQVFCTYDEIREGLRWYVGFIKHSYKKHHVQTALEWLRDRQMIRTRRTTRGLVITVCNYITYQEPANYAGYSEMESDRNQSIISPSSIREESMKKEEERIICAEESSGLSEQMGASLLCIPLIARDGEFHIYQKDIDEWQDIFPAVDILAELKRCRLWALDNPTKRKTRKGIRKHISTWLGRAQDKSSEKSKLKIGVDGWMQ